MKYKRCEQNRHDCFACKNGRCRVLNDTHFIKPYTHKTYTCPFYKHKNTVPYSVLIELDEEENYDTAEMGLQDA